MKLHSNAIVNRIEIFIYSILISFMSAVGRIRAHSDQAGIVPVSEVVNHNDNNVNQADEYTAKPSVNFWSNISNTVVPLLIWMVLGFAAGFLIGMINPG